MSIETILRKNLDALVTKFGDKPPYIDLNRFPPSKGRMVHILDENHYIFKGRKKYFVGLTNVGWRRTTVLPDEDHNPG